MRKEKIVPGHYYHVYNRGVNYQPIFFGRDNYIFFLQRLREYLLGEDRNRVFVKNPVSQRSATATVIAYCLMPNYYHLLILVLIESFGKAAMQPFGVSYTKAINNQQGRVGSLFQGPFQARHVTNERYLLHLSRYIHLNPVTAALVQHPADWEFSSYRDYVGLRQGALPQPDVVLSYFASSKDTRNRVFVKNSVSRLDDIQQAYAEYVCGEADHRAGLTADLLFD
jgi:putative transposase